MLKSRESQRRGPTWPKDKNRSNVYEMIELNSSRRRSTSMNSEGIREVYLRDADNQEVTLEAQLALSIAWPKSSKLLIGIPNSITSTLKKLNPTKTSCLMKDKRVQ